MFGGAGALGGFQNQRAAGKKFNQEVDTNVYRINMSTLKEGSELATGDPIFCSSCNAVFNMYSNVEEVKRDEGEEC